jgi:hypothetical protein
MRLPVPRGSVTTCAGAAVLECQTHACGQPVVHRELVVGLFVACFHAIDEVPHVVAVDPLLGELVDQRPSSSATATA